MRSDIDHMMLNTAKHRLSANISGAIEGRQFDGKCYHLLVRNN